MDAQNEAAKVAEANPPEAAPVDRKAAATDAIFVAYVEGQGRGVFASRDIAPGEVLYQEEPYIMVPQVTKHGNQTCLHCVKQFPRPSAAESVADQQCARCLEFYCSATCRKAYEVQHVGTGECTALFRCLPAKGKLSTDDFNNLRGIAAMVMRCRIEGKERLLDERRPRRAVRGAEGVELVLPRLAVREPEKMDLSNPSTDFSVVASLTTNISLMFDEQMDTYKESYAVYETLLEAQDEEDEEDDEGEDDEEEEEENESVAVNPDAPLVNISPRLARLPYVSDWMFEKIACAYQCNGFSIWNEHDKESASGVYGFAAMINHSCVPNTVKTFTVKTLNFVAKTPIKKGEQLFISYVDVNLGYNLRQWRLSSGYYIDECYCPKCKRRV